MSNNEELKIQLLQIFRVGLSIAVLLVVLVGGFGLSSKFGIALNSVVMSVIAFGAAIATFIGFSKITTRLGITRQGADRSTVNPALTKSGVSINSVRFGNMQGLQLVEQDATTRKWQTKEGDMLILRLFPEATHNPVPLSDMQEVRAQYKEIAAQGGGALIDIELVSYSGIPCLEMISKTRMQPTGMTYAASASLLLKDFCFNIGYYSREVGMTGLREALIADRFFADNPSIPAEEFDAMWFEKSSNPHAAQRNRADDECYDVEFPDHPLSRCRKFLRDLRTQIIMEPEVRNAEPFPI